MSSQNQHNDQPLEQGTLFPVVAPEGKLPVIGEVTEGGVYPVETAPEPDEVTPFHQKVHEAVVAEQATRNRRAAQLGKHSPLERDGTYLAVKAGDVLPGFGIVTHSNFEDAQKHARIIEDKRVAQLALQPMLPTPNAAKVEDIIADTAEALDIKRGLIDFLPGKPPKDPEVAGTKRKLQGLRDDDRAGFLPTTHREKSSGFELLDYQIPGKHKRGVSTRLDEIFFHQQNEAAKAGLTPNEGHAIAQDTVRSIIREWGDYYADARASWRKLNQLEKLVDEPNPQLTVEVLLEDEGNGETIAQVVRHNALKQLRDTDKPLGFDPLWVREDRTKPTDEKHKTVEDVFTHQGEEFMAAYVRRRAKQMTVLEVRRATIEAKREQALRAKFWRGILESLDTDYQEQAQLALGAAKAA